MVVNTVVYIKSSLGLRFIDFEEFTINILNIPVFYTFSIFFNPPLFSQMKTEQFLKVTQILRG